MTDTTRRVQAVRGYLARLVAVVVVLAGLALAYGFQCIDGMTVMHVAPGAGMAVGADRDCGAASMAVVDSGAPELVTAGIGLSLAAACSVPGRSGVFASSGDGSHGSGGLGGVLATCLAFLIAVVAAVCAVAGLRCTGWRSIVRAPQSARVAVIRSVRPRAPSLAELCLLRT